MRKNEVFFSIQGEGVYAGMPTVFIRLNGCNLRCVWCDTKYAQDVFGGSEATVADICDEVLIKAPEFFGWVCITGGEPLFQANELESLIRALRDRGHRIEIETNGSILPPTWSDLVDSWCVDMKCPSSGMQDKNQESWFNARPQDQIKFVVSDEKDLEFTRAMLSRHPAVEFEFRYDPTILISPVINSTIQLGMKKDYYMSGVWFQRCVEFVKEHNLRLSLQLHKFIWPPDQRGV